MVRWYDRQAGSQAAQSQDDPGEMMLGSPTPDWVRLPQELGGAPARVIDRVVRPCPACRDHNVRHYKLDAVVDVAECKTRGFLWYRKQGEQS